VGVFEDGGVVFSHPILGWRSCFSCFVGSFSSCSVKSDVGVVKSDVVSEPIDESEYVVVESEWVFHQSLMF
jgi:threonine dehydrogenase-like Zn-dependent dehydrogenase